MLRFIEKLLILRKLLNIVFFFQTTFRKTFFPYKIVLYSDKTDIYIYMCVCVNAYTVYTYTAFMNAYRVVYLIRVYVLLLIRFMLPSLKAPQNSKVAILIFYNKIGK